MSADRLREAARVLRDPDRCNRPVYEDALADWLNNAAEDAEMLAPGGALERFQDFRVSYNTEKATAVACLILGGDA